MRKSINQIMNSIPKEVKASLVIFIASFITSAMSLVVTPIFSRLMSTAEYGLITQYNSWHDIIAVFATLSLSAGVYQVAMNEYPKERDQFTFSAMVLSVVATLVTFGVVFCINYLFPDIFRLSNSLLGLMFVSLLFTPAMTMWLAKQRYEYNYIVVAIVSVGSTLLSQIISLCCVLSFRQYNLGEVRLWAMQVPMVIVSIVILGYLAKKSRYKPVKKFFIFALTFNLPLLPHYLAQYALRSTDKIMITNFLGESATGIYGLASLVSSIATLAWAAMSASLTPYIYANLNTKEHKKINKAIIFVGTIFAACCILVSLVGPEAIWILGSKKYLDGIYLIPPIAASCLLSAIYSYYSTIAFYYHKKVSTAVMTIIAAIINFGLNYWFIPQYGFVAAAYTTEAAYLIYTFLHFLNYRRIVKKDRVYNDKAIWLLVGVTTVLCLLSSILYPYIIIRYVFLFLIILVAIILRKRIFQMVKTIVKSRE